MRIMEPRRGSYKREFGSTGCVFCERDHEVECTMLNGEHWLVRANRYPYMDGNVMIIPFRHVEHTADLTADEWREFGEVLTRVQAALGEAFDRRSFNIGLNLGPESGASIPHLHWQVIPRKVDNLHVTNIFADLYVVSTTPEETKRMIDRVTGAAADSAQSDQAK